MRIAKLRRQSTVQPVIWQCLTKKLAADVRLREIEIATSNDLSLDPELIKALRPIVRRAINKKQMLKMCPKAKAIASQHLIKPEIDQITDEELTNFTPSLIHVLTAEELSMFSERQLWFIPEDIIKLLRREQKLLLNSQQLLAVELRLKYKPNIDDFQYWEELPEWFIERVFFANVNLPCHRLSPNTRRNFLNHARILSC